MSRFKKISLIVSVVLITALLCSCDNNKPGMSGEYNIDEFLEIMKPANEFINESYNQEVNDDEQQENSQKYDQILRDIGFKNEDKITLTGYFDNALTSKDVITILVSDVVGDEFVSIQGKYADVGICYATPENSKITISFEVVEEDIDGIDYLTFTNGKVLSPDKVEYSPNLDMDKSSYNTIVMGKVSLIDDLVDSEEAWEQWQETGNEYSYAASHSNKYVVIDDDAGNRLVTYINMEYGPEIKEGDRISVYGHATDAYRDYKVIDTFMDAGWGGYYIFD